MFWLNGHAEKADDFLKCRQLGTQDFDSPKSL